MPRRNRIIAASVQDRDAARPLPWNPHRACRPIRLVWADAMYATSSDLRAESAIGARLAVRDIPCGYLPW